MQLFDLTFQPDGLKITAPAGTTIMEAANRAGIIIDAVCGGKGTCNKCLVEITGSTEPVRACQHHIDCDMTVTIPDSSRFFEQKILQEGIAAEAVIDPPVCKHYLQLSAPSLTDLRSDADRLIDAVEHPDALCAHTCRDHCGTASGATSIAWPLLRQLPALFRDDNFAVTALCHSKRLFALETGDTTASLFGLAADIGTTTVVTALVNLINGQTIAIASETNPQVTFGDDVISRIEHSRANPNGLQQLHHRIVDCLNRLIGQLCEKSLVKPWQIYELAVAGNATMQHLLLGIPVEQIAQAPYVSAVCSAVNVPAEGLGLDIHPQGNVYVMPSVAAHIGGDTVAVALATSMRTSKTINLALDIGTNGEIVLGDAEHLFACSAAAGPAFEGARIAQGMRAAAGAIEQIHISDDVEISVIGGDKPIGICGSGLIDAIAELLNVGIVDTTGRILTGDELPANLPAALSTRVIEQNGAPSFVLASDQQTKNGKAITLTQRDIRQAQLGKAAINAGITALLQQAGISLDQIDQVFLAGAFGNYIRPASARRMGLLPDLPLEKIRFVGNAAAVGAKQVLLSTKARLNAEQTAQVIQYIELAGHPQFQDLFSENMFFPEK